MSNWINGVCDKVDQLAAQDPYYQELNVLRTELEPIYLEVLRSLPEAEQDIITEYGYILSEMAYQRTQAAYRFGLHSRKP